jgi:hypothetical protein
MVREYRKMEGLGQLQFWIYDFRLGITSSCVGVECISRKGAKVHSQRPQNSGTSILSGVELWFLVTFWHS